MNTILRVSAFPTVDRPGMGMHPSKLCGIDQFETIYLTPREKSSRVKVSGKYCLVESDLLLDARPVEGTRLAKNFFQLKRLFSLMGFSLCGIKLLHKNHVDIVHIHSPMFVLVALYGFILKKRVYITFHGTDFYRIKNAVWYRYISFIFTRVFAISPDMLESLSLIHGEKKVELVNNGVDLQCYKNFNRARKKQIIAVGALKIEKGFCYLIDAFSLLVLEGYLDDYELVFVGDGLLKDTLGKQVTTLNMLHKIKFVGQKNRESLIKLYNESEIFVLSSISEGFPKVLLEALSCGCKIIATDVGAVSQVISKDFLLLPGDVESLKKSILDTIENTINIKTDYKQFTWEKVREKYQHEYSKSL